MALQAVFQKGLMAALAVQIAASEAGAMDVRLDLGGSLAARLQAVAELERADVAVRITGTCVSACTLYLGLPRACVAPGARLGFHGPSTSLPGIPLNHNDFERLSREMARHYPPAISAWFMAKARLRTGSYFILTGAEAIRLGARRCA